MSFKKILKTVVIWRVVLTLIAIIAPTLISYDPSFPYSDSILANYGPKWIHSWANFDGVHYLTIIKKGYLDTGYIQAFFPLFPIIIKFFSFSIFNPIIVSVLLSILFLSIGLFYLQKLINIDEKLKISQKTIKLLLLFPTAFFFTAFYTESLFFMLIVLSLYFARRSNWLKASILAGLASATRITGIILLPALLLEYWEQKKVQKITTKDIIPTLKISISGLGLVSYMFYLYKKFSDPILFFHVQNQFGVGRQTDKLIMLYQVFFRYTKMMLTVQKNSLTFYNVTLEFTVGILFLALLILAFKHTRKSYAFFGLVSYILPTLTGTFTSLPRYVLTLFPAFIVLAKLLKNKKYLIFATLSGILLVVNTILFIQGRWIA